MKPIYSQRSPGWGIAIAMLVMLMLGAGWFIRYGTIQGVPTSIVLKFLMDDQAREAYFAKQPATLHNRLQDLNIESDIKAFYRPHFQDEAELDWYVHQLFYERSGYIGKAYKVGANDQLVLKTQADRQFPQWWSLAIGLNLVSQYRQENGVIYITMPDGLEIPYSDLAQIYDLKLLRKMVRLQKRQRLQSELKL